LQFARHPRELFCERRGMPQGDARRALHGEEGTASVELIATVPFLLLALALVAQAALAGHALWSASVAARAGARAALVGGDAAAVARRALPPALRRGAWVENSEGPVSVRVRVPALLPLPALRVGASSGLEDGGG
jgi:hypothetical protein